MGKSLLDEARYVLRSYADPSDAKNLQRFFKTGPGEYGEGDKFIGVRVPSTRKVARKFKMLSIDDTLTLLVSEIHEERLLALIILVHKFQKGTADEQADIYKLYLANTSYINNWDLVDTSAEHIVGAFLKNRSRKPLALLARSESLWERRIAVMATFHYIKQNEFDETLKIARMLVTDTHDLIHKSIGWMLREVGKKDLSMEELFLKKHYHDMPRTMLRYAIEKFPEDLRQQYLKGMVS